MPKRKRAAVGKLVRDRIPAIIEASGRVATVRVLGDEDYDVALFDKLIEEVDELRDATPSHASRKLRTSMRSFSRSSRG